MKTQKRALGDIGENIACDFLTGRGYQILARNYLRRWGEIDIVARIRNRLHFIEVKSVTCNLNRLVPHVTVRPEENLHPGKLMRLHRTIQTYLAENKVEEDFQLDLITVWIDKDTRRARVELFENII